MFGLISLWYKSKVLKYRALTSSVDEMHDRGEALGLGGLTLTELGQLHYMGQELLTIAQVGSQAVKAAKLWDERRAEKDTESPEVPVNEDDGNTGQYL